MTLPRRRRPTGVTRMHRRTACLVLALLLCGCEQAVAQTACPVGVAPGSPQCGPTPQAAAPAAPAQSEPLGRWVNMWGALAQSEGDQVFAASNGQKSKRAAEREAVAKCNREGGRNCTPRFTYSNACVAVSRALAPGLQGFVVSGEAESVQQEALSKCDQGNAGQCEIVYTDCSLPRYKVYQGWFK